MIYLFLSQIQYLCFAPNLNCVTALLMLYLCFWLVCANTIIGPFHRACLLGRLGGLAVLLLRLPAYRDVLTLKIAYCVLKYNFMYPNLSITECTFLFTLLFTIYFIPSPINAKSVVWVIRKCSISDILHRFGNKSPEKQES